MEKELIDKFGKNVIIYLEEYLLCSYMSDCVEYMNDFMYCWELINKADVGLAIPYFEYCLIQGCYKTFVSHFLVLYDRYYSIDTELCEDKINCVKDFLENGQSSKVWNKFNKMRNEMPMMLKFNEQCRSTPEWFRFYVERNFYELKNCYAKKERIVL